MKMSNYHIFKVYDYKGGELISSINLNKEQFIDELTELLRFDYIIDDSEDLDFYDDGNIIEESVIKVINAFSIEDLEFSEYAGDNNTVWEAFEIIEDKLVSISLTEELFVECKTHYLKNWR